MTTASALVSSLAGAPAQTHQATRARKNAEASATQAIQRVGDLIEIHLRSVEEGTDENSAAQLRIDPRSQRQSGSSSNPREQNRNPHPRNKPQAQPQSTPTPTASPTATGPGSEDHLPATGISPAQAGSQAHGITHAAASGYATSNPGQAALYKHLDIKA